MPKNKANYRREAGSGPTFPLFRGSAKKRELIKWTEKENHFKEKKNNKEESIFLGKARTGNFQGGRRNELSDYSKAISNLKKCTHRGKECEEKVQRQLF